MTLRRLFSSAAALLASLTAMASIALVLVTTEMHLATRSLADALGSVRRLDRVEVALRLHGQLVDLVDGVHVTATPLPLEPIELDLRRQLRAAEQRANDAAERALIGEARTRADEYLGAAHTVLASPIPRPAGRVEAAQRALERAITASQRVVALNVDQASAMRAHAARWDRRSDVFGTAIIALLVLGVAVVVMLVRYNVYRPLVALRESIAEYGTGARWARAPERGPAELRDIARAFNEMATALGRQHESQLAFIAGVVHDLRNPLSALRAATGLFAPERGMPPEASARKAMALVGRQVDRLDQMLGDLLDHTRIEAGQLSLRLAARDARDFARDVVELYRASSPRHELVAVIGEQPLRVSCDPVRIEQVLGNLVSNAIKYSPEGGRVEVRTSREKDCAVIAVSDSGVGIAPEELGRVFEPFHRTSATRDGFPGAGLGLAVARRIVEAHGGRIEVESTPGAGSTFRVRLPLASTEASRGEAAPAASGQAAERDDDGSSPHGAPQVG